MHRYGYDYEEALGEGERQAARWKHMTPKTKKMHRSKAEGVALCIQGKYSEEASGLLR